MQPKKWYYPLQVDTQKNLHVIMGVRVTLGGDLFMAKKGQIFQSYTEEFKMEAVRAYMEGSSSYMVVAEQLKIRNCSQLKVWVKKWQNGDSFDERKSEINPLKGRPRTTFGSVEEERDYLKAQVDYLKKRYPNLIKEKPSVSGITME
jgi:transposase